MVGPGLGGNGRVREAGLVGQELKQGDLALAVGGELGDVLGDAVGEATSSQTVAPTTTFVCE